MKRIQPPFIRRYLTKLKQRVDLYVLRAGFEERFGRKATEKDQQAIREEYFAAERRAEEAEQAATDMLKQQLRAKFDAIKCRVPSHNIGVCEEPWGHDGRMHSNGGDGFYARDYDEEHAERQGILAALAQSADAPETSANINCVCESYGDGDPHAEFCPMYHKEGP